MTELARLPAAPFLYVLTDVTAGGARPAELVRRLFAAGVAIVQLRAKDLDDRDLLAEAEAAARHAAVAGGLLVVNDRVDIALAAGAGGVHLGHRDMPATAVRRLAGGSRLVIGVSSHSAGEAAEAAAEPVDYVALGPIYASSTKAGCEPVGCDELVRAREMVARPLVAIGGIDQSRVAEVAASGCDGVAVVGAAYAGGLEAAVPRLVRCLGMGASRDRAGG